MTRCMTLFLVRHGETVDNVARLYAGSRDSELTNHGYQQATRLGLHFKSLGLTFTHVFSSQLQRAVKTAGKIREAQLASHGEDGNARIAPEVVQLPILMEQDFGSMEGKKFFERAVETKITDKEHNRTPNKNSGAFVDAEPKEVMARRADRFLDDHIWPLLRDDAETADPVVAIVSHGIFLSTLWKRLLLRLLGKSVALSPELQATARRSLEHLGGWSNTGYLELQMLQDKREELELKELEPSRAVLGSPIQSTADDMKSATVQGQGKVVLPQSVDSGGSTTISSRGELGSPPTTPSRQPSTAKLVQGWTMTIRTINGKDHLKRLKRTGGGVGSSRHDASQKSIETFFKRRKIE